MTGATQIPSAEPDRPDRVPTTVDRTSPEQLDLIGLGSRIRDLRARRQLSLSALAAAAGIGKGSLSELEAGVRNPTLATLYAVAAPLGVPLATLLADEIGAVVEGDGLRAQLLDSRVEVVESHPNPGTPVDTRAAGAADTAVEVYRLSFAPGADRSSSAHADGAREHLLVTSGQLRIDHRHGTEELLPGGFLDFAGDGEHRYRAGAAGCTAILVITTPHR